MFAFLLSALVAQASPTPSATPSAAPIPTPTPVASSAPFSFAPPTGWTAGGMSGSLGESTVVGSWSTGSGLETQTLNMVVSPARGLSQDAYATTSLKAIKNVKGLEILSVAPVTLCNGVRGETVKYALTLLNARMTLTQVFAVNNNLAYVATYGRSAASSDDSQALAALSALCPVGVPLVVVAKADTLAPITAPTGWTESSLGVNLGSSGKTLWVWTHGTTASPEILEAIALPITGRMTDVSPAQDDLLVNGFKNGMKMFATDMTVLEQKPITLCQSRGIFLRMTGTAFSKSMDIEAVLAPGTPMTYAAVYMRFKDAVENADAVKAIESICPSTASPAS